MNTKENTTGRQTLAIPEPTHATTTYHWRAVSYSQTSILLTGLAVRTRTLRLLGASLSSSNTKDEYEPIYSKPIEPRDSSSVGSWCCCSVVFVPNSVSSQARGLGFLNFIIGVYVRH